MYFVNNLQLKKYIILLVKKIKGFDSMNKKDRRIKENNKKWNEKEKELSTKPIKNEIKVDSSRGSGKDAKIWILFAKRSILFVW